MSQPTRTVPAPLFDRLVSPELPGRGKPTLTLEELRESVRREIERLLNTTMSRQPPARDWTVLDYGIPELTGVTPASDRDRKTMASYMAYAIHCFEPRLRGCRVQLKPLENGRELVALVSGWLIVGEVKESVNFPVHISGETD